jgi:hypothetical protein
MRGYALGCPKVTSRPPERRPVDWTTIPSCSCWRGGSIVPSLGPSFGPDLKQMAMGVASQVEREWSMSDVLTRALLLEFPGTALNQLLIDHPLARVEAAGATKYVVIPGTCGEAVYYVYRQRSLHRLNSEPLALRKRQRRALPFPEDSRQ